MTASSKTLPCRFYALASCTKGKDCPYLHNSNTRATTVCSFFLAGNCHYGDRCVLSHVKPSTPTKPTAIKAKAAPTAAVSRSAVSPKLPLPDTSPATSATLHTEGRSYSRMAQTAVTPLPSDLVHSQLRSTCYLQTLNDRAPMCPFALNGACKFGIKCRYTHGMECPECKKYCLHPADPDSVHDAHIESCKASHETETTDFQDGNTKECVVCMEKVAEKSNPRFGLLVCEHCVCLECIRTWRTKETMGTAKTCPICRAVTYLVVPSSVWPTDSSSKEQIVQNYRTHLRQIDCKHFNYGEGTCPFSTSCLYRHADRIGAEIQSRPRFLMCADDADEGTAHALKQVHLFDFLEQYDQQRSGTGS
ncbi:hypothetical protein BASA61_003153 [Batrachochytrium salamandrivorans]|nr:hypothetical protein BASA61_003153 [Batrachochytrium salamandrivorans]